ncbi:Nif3-like dinuclear metal center hexameric protein [Candidatus Mycoplasma pogonae]
MTIFSFLNQKYPQEKSAEWDPVGFSFYFQENVKNVLIALDVTIEVVEFAIQNKIDTIITHHPFKFYSTWKEEYQKAPYKQKIIKLVKQHQINIFTIHTNFDGSNFATARAIAKVLKINANAKKNIIDDYNLIFESSIKLENIIKNLAKFGLKNYSSNFNIADILEFTTNKIAILPGSGGIEAIVKAQKMSANLIITSDLKWSDWLTIKHFKKHIVILEIAHLIESVFCQTIAKQLKTKFPFTKFFIFEDKEIKKNYNYNN